MTTAYPPSIFEAKSLFSYSGNYFPSSAVPLFLHTIVFAVSLDSSPKPTLRSLTYTRLRATPSNERQLESESKAGMDFSPQPGCTLLGGDFGSRVGRQP